MHEESPTVAQERCHCYTLRCARCRVVAWTVLRAAPCYAADAMRR